MKIYQHVDEFKDGDGIGNDIKGLHSIFQDIGYDSTVIARKNETSGVVPHIIPNRSILFRNNDIHILHYGGSGQDSKFFLKIKGKKILRFHNITPSFFFRGKTTPELYDSFEFSEMKSMIEMQRLNDCISCSFHDSEFNQLSYKNYLNSTDNFSGKEAKKSLVIPIVRTYRVVRNPKTEMNFKIGFIGRFVPNKKIEDLISLLYSLRRIDTRYRLVLIGKPSPVFLKYYEYLLSFIALSGLSSSVAIYENPGDEETGKLLSDLDFYVSMSEHEGFGIPLLEAFARGVPVLSFYSSAVPETMRGGGILFRKKTMGYLSELIHSINSKSEIRNKIVESQLKSLEYYNSFPFREKIQEMIRAVQIEN